MDDQARHLELALLAADASQRITARRGLALDRAGAVSRATDLRRARAKGEAQAEAARTALHLAASRLVTARGDAERSFVERLPPVERGAILHGRIHGPDGAGIAELVVRVLGADNKPVGETKTGVRGYFRIDLAAGERPPGRLPTIDAGSAATQLRMKLRVAVFDGAREILVEKGTTLVRPGRSVYRDILIAKQENPPRQ